MNLYDPNRPTLINGQKCWQRNHIAISDFKIKPLETGDVKISIFLPIKEDFYCCMEFSVILDGQYLWSFMENFKNDPEQHCEFYFTNPDPNLMPELRVGGKLSARLPDDTSRPITNTKRQVRKININELDF